MASGERFSGYPAVFGYNDGASQTMNLRHLQAKTLNPNNMVGVMHPPGSVDPAAFLVARSKPVYNLRTPDLATLFGVIGFRTGFCFDETSTFTLQEREDCSTFVSGSTHTKHAIAKGFMYLDNITAELESENGAMANLNFVPLASAQGTLPITISGANALPSTTPTFVSAYHLGPIYVDGTEIPGVFSQTITPGIRIEPTPHTPGCFDTHVSIIQRDPQLSFMCKKTDEFDAFKLTGDNVTVSWAFYLQKADSTNATGDGRIAKATGAHVEVAAQSGRVEVRSVSFEGVESAGVEVVFTPSGSVTFAIDSTIPS